MPSAVKRLKQRDAVSGKRFAFRRERQAEDAGGRSFLDKAMLQDVPTKSCRACAATRPC